VCVTDYHSRTWLWLWLGLVLFVLAILESWTQGLVSSITEVAWLVLFELSVSLPCVGKSESSGMSEG
jgi:hypothetical protein